MLVNGVDLVRDEPVGLPVHGVGGIRVWCLDEAKDLPRLLIDPVPQIVDAVRTLGGQICPMGAGDIGFRNAALNGVDVHEKRHDVLISCHDPHGSPVCCRQHIA